MEAEMMPPDELVEQWFQRCHVALSFASQQHTESAGQGHAHGSRDAATIAFVDQQQARRSFDRQRDGFGLAGIERCFELSDERPIDGAATFSHDVTRAAVASIFPGESAGLSATSRQTTSGTITSP
jgi:hypothetical protein